MPITNTTSLDPNIDPQLLFSLPSSPVEFTPRPPSASRPNHATDYDSHISALPELCRATTSQHRVQEGVVRHALLPYNLNATVHTPLDISTPPSASASAHILASTIQAVSSAQSSSICVSSTRSLPVTQTSPSSSKMANDDSQLLNIPSFPLGSPNLVDIACVYNGCDGSKTFKGRKAWRNHLRMYHKVPGGASAQGACLYPGCDQVRARGKGGLIRHIIADHSQVGLQCRQCNRKPFTREDPLLRHYKRVHRDQYFKDHEDVVYSDEVEINW
ncbi:hypothetical protein BDN70DRAFT_929648 [Pholiota conissans]|uniref:C2H2-type domain-containing protein n=1 Tax=Pholiota conissans TaxID=109636 RepID=A0A9P5Z741_9AGAR|nr:hypothetical protein BDN70DRAFT_929648 [Pholiota conissans]